MGTMHKDISLLRKPEGDAIFVFWHDARSRRCRPVVIDSRGRVQQLVWYTVPAARYIHEDVLVPACTRMILMLG